MSKEPENTRWATIWIAVNDLKCYILFGKWKAKLKSATRFYFSLLMDLPDHFVAAIDSASKYLQRFIGSYTVGLSCIQRIFRLFASCFLCRILFPTQASLRRKFIRIAMRKVK